MKRTPAQDRAARKLNYKKKYGLTVKQVKNLAKSQAYHCAICDRHENEVGTLCVDHCHTTKRVRGLLCFRCNLVLGMVEKTENPEKMLAMIHLYLIDPPAKQLE